MKVVNAAHLFLLTTLYGSNVIFSFGAGGVESGTGTNGDTSNIDFF